MPKRTFSDRRWVDETGALMDEQDRGLQYDLQTLVSRRAVLGLFGVMGVGGLVAACTSSGGGDRPSSTTSASAPPVPPAAPSVSTASTGPHNTDDPVEIPDETNGPYPADGSNGPNVLGDSGIVRRDITASFGSSTTKAAGVPLTVTMTAIDRSSGDPLAGKAVYIWHCDRGGRYSLYSPGAEQENYLRGVQVTDRSGSVVFTSIFPGCYAGRWPHIHFEVYESARSVAHPDGLLKTSQLAFPKAVCDEVYARSGYEQSPSNLSRLSLRTDNVFGNDGGVHQMAAMHGSPANGYTAALPFAL
jgi:protocatechuate 3,4-dioxygenase beta subunit